MKGPTEPLISYPTEPLIYQACEGVGVSGRKGIDQEALYCTGHRMDWGMRLDKRWEQRVGGGEERKMKGLLIHHDFLREGESFYDCK
jgi:hypothetical protein